MKLTNNTAKTIVLPDLEDGTPGLVIPVSTTGISVKPEVMVKYRNIQAALTEFAAGNISVTFEATDDAFFKSEHSFPLTTVGVHSVNVTEVATLTATGETDLQTATLPADVMGNKGVIKITAAGQVTGGNAAKTIRLRFGTQILATVAEALGEAQDWVIEAIVANDVTVAGDGTRTFAQKSIAIAHQAGAIEVGDYVASTIDTSAAVVIKTTGETPNAGDEVISELLMVEVLK